MKKIAERIIIIFILISLFSTIVVSDTIVRYPRVPQMDRVTLGYSPDSQQGHPSMCQMSNGSYVYTYGMHFTGVKLRTANSPTDLTGPEHTVIPSSKMQPDIQCLDGSLWICCHNAAQDSIEIWNCSESDDITDAANWNYVSTPIDDDYVVSVEGWFYEGPCDPSFYIFDEPVNGHKYWIECLDHNGTGESNDNDRYIFYSDDLTADDWQIGNNERPVLQSYVPGQGNWPLDGLYIPEAEGWIIFTTQEDNQSTSQNMSNVYYVWTNNINTTWNKTWIKVLPRDVNESTSEDDFMTLAPDIIRIENTVYCYYMYLANGQNNNQNCKVCGITTYNISAFIDPDFEFQKVSGAKNNGYFPTGTQFQFNFTNATGATCYQIQVSNSSDFSTTFINETIYDGCDIMSEAGASFTYKGDYIEINLPHSYNLTYSGTHYLRVRPGYHAV